MNPYHSFWDKALAAYGGDGIKLWKETGLLVPIAGGAKGYNETADILTRTVDGFSFEELYNQIAASIRILNANRNALVQRLVFQVTTPYEEVMQIIGDEFEEADEFGQPKGIRLGAPWNMGFPLKYWDLGIRYTFRFLGRASAAQVRALNNSALEADQRLIFKTILDRVFNNTNTAVTLEASGTATTSYPFYNGDVTALPVAPPTWKSYSHLTTHTHYLASGAGTVVSGDLDDMELHIYHHGYAEGAQLILVVNRAQMNVISTFTVAGGDRYDFIPKAGVSFLGTLVGSQPGDPSGLGSYPGFQGMYGNIAVVQEDYIPADYMVMFASGGRFAERNPIGLREHENEALRGLKIIPQFERYPLREAFYHHALGAGIRHPGAGVVMKVTAGSYDIPTLNYQGQGGR